MSRNRFIEIILLCLLGSSAPALAGPEDDGVSSSAEAAESAASKIGGPSAAAAAGPAPEIELITMGVGALLWERFGHTALCTHQAGKPIICYNYGTTNFREPATLVWEFLRGRARFWVSRSSRQAMVRFYTEKLDRSLWSQKLPLAPEQARAAAAMLERNAQGDNKYYQYHHYDDNCATRVRDILDEVTGGALSAVKGPYDFSLREVTRRGLSEFTAFVWLSDFGIGRPADRIPSMHEAMHLPMILRDYVTSELGVEPSLIYQRQGREFNVSDPPSRYWLILFALIIAAPAFLAWLWGRFRRLGLAISVLPGGFIGIILWTGVIISSLPEIRWNEAALVMIPLDLAMPWLAPGKGRRYAQIRLAGLALVGLLAAIGVLHQPLWMPILVAGLPCAIAALPDRR